MPSVLVGVVEGVFIGTGGVPKNPVEAADVTVAGVVGDHQKMHKIHGRPWQALCLWSADVVDELRDEGHPIFAGACGENVSVRGIDWTAIRPGARVRIGTVLAEFTEATVPCRQIRPYFAGAAIRRISHDRYPGCSRWYASVVEPGRIAVGDPVAIDAPAPRQRVQKALEA